MFNEDTSHPVHQGYLCLLPRCQKWAVPRRERKTIRMDLASCQFPCIVPTVTTQRKSVLYFDVVTHQQPVFQEALHALQASAFNGKNFSDNLHSIKNTEDLTMKQMFEISEKLITEQNQWEHSAWKYLSLVGDEQVISLLRTKVCVFSDFALCHGKVNENPKSNIAWEDRLTWFKSSPEYRTLDRIDGEPTEFEWNIFPGFTTLHAALQQNPRVTHLHVDVQRHLMVI